MKRNDPRGAYYHGRQHGYSRRAMIAVQRRTPNYLIGYLDGVRERSMHQLYEGLNRYGISAGIFADPASYNFTMELTSTH